MRHLRLGEILINQGLITEQQLTRAIEVQKKEKGRIGEILIKTGIITVKSAMIRSVVATHEGLDPSFSLTSSLKSLSYRIVHAFWPKSKKWVVLLKKANFSEIEEVGSK